MFRISVFIYFITSSKIVLILLLFSCSVVSNSLWPHGLQHTRLLSSTVSEFAQTCAHWVNDAIQTLILCCPLLLLPSSFPNIRVFSNESALRIKWPKYWSLSISPSDEYSRLISFMIDWFDLLAVQGTLKSLLQHHSLKASIPQHSAFFMIQLLHLYMTTGKPIGLTMVFDYCLSFLICCLVLS